MADRSIPIGAVVPWLVRQPKSRPSPCEGADLYKAIPPAHTPPERPALSRYAARGAEPDPMGVLQELRGRGLPDELVGAIARAGGVPACLQAVLQSNPTVGTPMRSAPFRTMLSYGPSMAILLKDDG